MATVRAVWQAVEGSENVDQHKLKKEITDSVSRLKGRIDGKLGSGSVVVPPLGRLLFDEPVEEKKHLPPVVQDQPRFPEPALRVYGKDLAAHAIKHIPKLAGYKSIEDVRKYLLANLRFNSQATRRRNANYLISRFFPGEIVHPDVLAFAAAVEAKPALGDALFYLACRSERIVSLVANEVVFPSLAEGGVSRSRIRDFVQAQFPNSKSANQIGASIVGTYQAFGVGVANRTRLSVSLREGSLASFAYILHLEFPEPGMHGFEKMLDGPMHKWLLWDQQWMIPQLYRLREVGLLSKVSEIDRMRQFTTKFSLADAMRRIVALAKESSQ